MSGRFHTIATFFSYAYLLRIPILIGVVLIALPPIALWWAPARPLLENLFVLTAGNIFWAMIVALTLAWSLLVVWRVVLLNGEERFGIEQWKKQDTLRGRNLFWAGLPTLPLFVCAYVEKVRALSWIPWWKWLGAAFGGALIAYVAGFAALVLSVTLAPHYEGEAGPAEERYDIPFPFSKRILRWADKFRLIPFADPDRPARWAKVHVPKDLRSGYLDRDGHLYPGHWFVLMLLVISVILYEVVGSFKRAHLGMPSSVPALTYLFILMLVINWLLSMIAFFLDRYRIPLLAPIFLFCTLGGQFSQSDHYFELRDGISIRQVSPSDTLIIRSRRHPLPKNSNGVVVVATAGGGIQAAGWTARVLTGLQEQCSLVPGSNFADSIAAISAVSGGAVGTLFFVNQYKTVGVSPGFHASPADLQRIIDQAEAPALSDIAWAMAYVDPFRIFFPYRRNSAEEKTLDRGFVLEQTWRNRGSIYAYLSNWREGVTQGWRPGVIFNATIAETGQPFLLATTDFDTGGLSPARQTLTKAYPNCDMPVVTATRLAASFPYVSPAARPLSTKPEYHIVDGGYYDNFGVDSLAAWLDQALSGLPLGSRPDVLVIQIRSFPSDAIRAPASKGWFYQSYAPVDALMSVRTTAQLVRDREELTLLKEKWSTLDHARIEFATFEFTGEDAPLSWELTENQKNKIEIGWQRILTEGGKNNDLQAVRSFCNPQTVEMPAAASAPR